ncbi:MAG: FadR/GntR family transcriptional regulator [Caldilineaceae bacterium]
MLGIAQKSKVSDETVTQIIELIRQGGYAPGDRLPGERLLAARLKVSRTSVRAALERLTTLGLLAARPGSGTFVKEPKSELLLAALTPHIGNDAVTLRKLFELREIIEGEAAARAAQRATIEEIAAIRYWAEQVATCALRKDREGLVRADVEFHRQIVRAAGNDILVDLIDSIAHLLREMRQVSTNNPELLPGQRAVLAAIEAHNPVLARQAMLDHLQIVRTKAEAFLADKALANPTNAVRATLRSEEA